MKRNPNKQTFRKFEALVSGILWSGEKGYTSYDFEKMPTLDDVNKRSGDFQQVQSVKIVRHVHSVERIADLVGA